MRFALTLSALIFATPAAAQSDDDSAGGNHVTVGVGVASVPRFDGAPAGSIEPAFGVQGSLRGVSFSLQETAFVVDIIRRDRPLGGKFILGPVIHATLNRTSNSRTRDPQIVALGKLGIAVEPGIQVGYSRNGIASNYDNLSFRVIYVHDVSGTYKSYMVTPTISYGTPLSKRAYLGVSVSADYVGRGYARTYFGVSPGQSRASGLPVFDIGSGFKDVTISAIGLHSITGNLRHGLSVFVFGNYSKLISAIGDSPVTRNRSQLSGAIGLAFTF